MGCTSSKAFSKQPRNRDTKGTTQEKDSYKELVHDGNGPGGNRDSEKVKVSNLQKKEPPRYEPEPTHGLKDPALDEKDPALIEMAPTPTPAPAPELVPKSPRVQGVSAPRQAAYRRGNAATYTGGSVGCHTGSGATAASSSYGGFSGGYSGASTGFSGGSCGGAGFGGCSGI